jgi:Acetylornithine deacetylase/Succinyl-diaminopimelate desuccinylase and related deacylases
MQSDIARIHGVNERLAVDNYADVIAFYMRLIRTSTSNTQIVRSPLTFTSPHRERMGRTQSSVV